MQTFYKNVLNIFYKAFNGFSSEKQLLKNWFIKHLKSIKLPSLLWNLHRYLLYSLRASMVQHNFDSMSSVSFYS